LAYSPAAARGPGQSKSSFLTKDIATKQLPRVVAHEGHRSTDQLTALRFGHSHSFVHDLISVMGEPINTIPVREDLVASQRAGFLKTLLQVSDCLPESDCCIRLLKDLDFDFDLSLFKSPYTKDSIPC